MMAFTIIFLFLLNGRILTTNAFLSPGPGKLVNSTQIGNSGVYSCDLKTGKEGAGSKTKLTVTGCWASRWTKLSCGQTSTPKVYFIRKGETVEISDKDFRFSTKGIAKYFGDETCVSYVYIKADTLSRIEEAECRAECFTRNIPPRVTYYSHSSGGSFHASYQKFEAREIISAAGRIHVEGTLTLVALLTVFFIM